MASSLCSTSCGAIASPPPQYQDFCASNTFRRYGYPFFALIRCDIILNDPNDIADWQAEITADTLEIGPCGKIEIPTPAFETSSDIFECGGETVLKTTYNLTFTTYQTADDLSDCYYWQDILSGASNYRLIWIDCQDNVWMSDEYVDAVRNSSAPGTVAGSPGFEFTISASPHPVRGDGDKVRWEVTFQIELDGDEIICPAAVPGLRAALQA